MNSTDLRETPLTAVDRTTLRQLVVKLLQKKGMFVAEAEIVADRMIEADLQQHFDDGVASLLEYLDVMDLGDIDPRARNIVLNETPAIATVDGGTGMGHVATTKAMLMAVEKATAVGVGFVAIRNSRPCGDLGNLVKLAADRGLLGIASGTYTAAEDSPQADSDLAWAIPVPEGAAPVIQRNSLQNLNNEFSTLFRVLSSGLTTVDVRPIHRKAARAANAVEYSIAAIHWEKFGSRDAFHSRWKTSLSPAIVESEDTSTVSIRASDLQRLSELAAKIKFAVPW